MEKVTAHCLYGTRVPTIEKYHFKNGEFPDKQPTVTYGDGDGIVNKRSLEACNKWSGKKILSHPEVISWSGSFCNILRYGRAELY